LFRQVCFLSVIGSGAVVECNFPNRHFKNQLEVSELQLVMLNHVL